MNTKKNLEDCRLYGILDWAYIGSRDPILIAKEMMKGGIDILQLRAKNLTPRQIAAWAKQIIPITRESGVPLIINDYPDVALEVDAEGVHVGQEDISLTKIRKVLGSNVWVGKSTHSLEQALAAENEGADYIGVGPIFSTPTKPTYKPVGLELIEQVHKRITIPYFCIGGIKANNASQVVQKGASRIVVVSGILHAPDMKEYCKNLRDLLT